MELVRVSYLLLWSFGKHRTTSGRGGSKTNYVQQGDLFITGGFD